MEVKYMLPTIFSPRRNNLTFTNMFDSFVNTYLDGFSNLETTTVSDGKTMTTTRSLEPLKYDQNRIDIDTIISDLQKIKENHPDADKILVDTLGSLHIYSVKNFDLEDYEKEKRRKQYEELKKEFES